MTYALEQVAGLHQFQITQLATNRVTVKAVVKPERAQAIDDEIRSNLGPLLTKVKIEIELADRIEPDQGGKFRIVSSLVGGSE